MPEGAWAQGAEGSHQPLPAARSHRFDRTCNGTRRDDATCAIHGKPGYVGEEYQLLEELWRADLLTATSIREGRPAAKHDFAAADPDASLAFFRGLALTALFSGSRLADMIDIRDARSAIDIGGGPGHCLIGLRETKPDLQVTLLELPASIMLARKLLAGEPLADGLRFEVGNIVEAPSSTTHDLAILKAVIQVLSTGNAQRLSRACDHSCRRAKVNLAVADGLQRQLQDLAADFLSCFRIGPG